MEKIKIAAIQMPTVADKMENVRTVKAYLEKIKDEKPDFVILPEMFCCPYQTENFPIYAEKEGGPVWQQLSGYAKQYGIYLIGGSMQEKRWKVLYCDRPLAEVHRADDHRGFVRAACRLL